MTPNKTQTAALDAYVAEHAGISHVARQEMEGSTLRATLKTTSGSRTAIRIGARGKVTPVVFGSR